MNHIQKIALGAISACLMCISAYLTARFLFIIGERDGLQVIYSVTGIVLDLFKSLLPSIAVGLWLKGQLNQASLAALSCVLLVLLSLFCSYSSFEQSQQSGFESSESYKSAVAMVSNAQSKVDVILSQQAVYLESGMATKSASLNDSLSDAESAVTAAQNHLSALMAESKQAGGRTAANWIFSLAIELSCVVSVALFSQLSGSKSPVPVRVQASSGQHMQHGVQEVQEVQSTVKEVQEVRESFKTTTKTTSHQSVYSIAVRLFAVGMAKPSERSLSEKLNIPRYESQKLLAELESNGVLIRKGRNRALNPEFDLTEYVG